MPARPTWKGYLKISLVNIPIKVFPATDAGATLSFNQLHGECQTRIQQKRWCPHCEREVPNTDIVKGFEFEKGRYVIVDEEDVEKVRVESTRVINLEKFTDDTAIDPIYLERPYYLAPDGDVAKEAFAVIREGMQGKAGIGKVALYGREYLVKVQPREKGLVMYTLRHANEIRSMEAIEELDDMPTTVKPDEVKLARQVIGTFEVEVDKAPLDVHRAQPHAHAIADIDATIPVNDLAFDRRRPHARPDTLRRRTGDDGVEDIADPRPHEERGGRLSDLPLHFVRGIL